MSVEKTVLITRTIHVATCPGYGKKCDTKVVKETDAPREVFCKTCNRWVPYVIVSYTGKEIGSENNISKAR